MVKRSNAVAASLGLASGAEGDEACEECDDVCNDATLDESVSLESFEATREERSERAAVGRVALTRTGPVVTSDALDDRCTESDGDDVDDDDDDDDGGNTGGGAHGCTARLVNTALTRIFLAASTLRASRTCSVPTSDNGKRCGDGALAALVQYEASRTPRRTEPRGGSDTVSRLTPLTISAGSTSPLCLPPSDAVISSILA